MRHKKSVNHLGRQTGHRKAMLSNMATSLIMHKRITTTVAKAKELRKFVEPLITKSKDDSTNNRRVAFRYLQDKYAVSELFREVSVKVAKRPGGYTRILKTGNRLGDNADMCIMELVDYNENMLAASADKQEKSTRKRSRRGSGAKKSTDHEVVKKTVESASQTQKESQPKESAVNTNEEQPAGDGAQQADQLESQSDENMAKDDKPVQPDDEKPKNEE